MNFSCLRVSYEGFSVGHLSSAFNEEENQIKEKYYKIFSARFVQINLLGTILNKVSELYSSHSLTIFTQIITKSSSIKAVPMFLFLAAVRTGGYEKAAQFSNQKWNNCKYVSWIPIRLPEKLGERSIKVFDFFLKNTGKAIQAAIIVGALALVILGNPYFGAGAVLSLSYHLIDQMGVVPLKVSHFVNTVTPWIFIIGVFAYETSSVMKAFKIALSIFEICSRMDTFIYKIDMIFRKIFKSTPSLQEIDAPLDVDKKLTFDEINQILDGEDADYEVNPSHCSKDYNSLNMPLNDKFQSYLTLFESIDFSNNYNLLFQELKKDKCFCDFINQEKGKFLVNNLKFEEANVLEKVDVLENINDSEQEISLCIEKIASHKGISKEQYIKNYLKTNLVFLVESMQGEEEESFILKSCSKILTYLESIQKEQFSEFESLLLKVATINRNRGALNKQFFLNEIFNKCQRLSSKERGLSRVEDYELNINQRLQDIRELLVQKEMIPLPKILNIKPFFFKGVIPVEKFDLTNFITGRMLSSDIIPYLYRSYLKDMDKVIQECGEESLFFDYISQVIEENPNLNPVQKNVIKQRYETSNNTWDRRTKESFHRLMFVNLGVLRAGPVRKKELNKNTYKSHKKPVESRKNT